MRIIHYSHDSRENGNKGGVEKFGWYLQQATECVLYYSSKLPPSKHMPYAIAVVDGGYGTYFDSDQPMISMVHGTWKELHLRCNMTDGIETLKQHTIWNKPNVRRVASSPAVAKELYKHHGVHPDIVIMHGVNLNIFTSEYKKKSLPKVPVVIHAATDFVKRSKEVAKLKEELKGVFDIQFLDAKIGEEAEKFTRGDIFLHWSYYEGCSYAMIEAVASGLPIAGTAVGAFETPEINNEAGVFVNYDASKEEIIRALHEVADNYNKFNPREVAEVYFDYKRFKKDWINFIEREF